MATHSETGPPVRLLWLIDSLTLGGAESLILPFAEALDGQKFELTVCCLKTIGGNPIEERLREAHVAVVNIGARNLRDVAAFRRLLALLKERRTEIVHAHLTYAAIWGALASRLAKIPLLATLHVAPVTERLFHRDSIRELLMILLLRWRRATIIAVSDAVRRAFVAKYQLPPNSIVVIHNGVNVMRFERRNPERSIQLKQNFALPADALVVTTVAVLRFSKGIDILLRAVSHVAGAIPRARLLVAGEGPLQEQWSNLALHLGVAEAVIWAGYRKDVPAILAGSDLFVLPSREDAFPTVLLEAMAAELPVVATNVGGVSEIIDSSATGSLVPPRDPAALGAEIVRLLEDDARRRSMAVAARRRVAGDFSIQRWLERLTTAYREARGERTGPLRVAVVEFAGKGGLIHYAFQLCRAMANEGAGVTLLTDRNYELGALDHPFRLLKIFELWDPKSASAGSSGIVRRAWRALRYYGQWLKLAAHLREEKYDVVQMGDLRFPADLFPLMLIRRRARVLSDICHNVRRFSGARRFGASALSGLAYRRIYALFDRIFVHYETNAARFSADFPSSAKKVRVIVHGNQEVFRELQAPAVDLRGSLGFDAGDSIVLFFGTLSPYKGIDGLIEAFASVALRHPRARLLIAGFALPGFDIERHLALARGFALGDRVRVIPGYVEVAHVAAWMELASIIVFPYREIYQSGTVHLAQTFGLPIVATRVGAMSEVIEDGMTGLLVPQDDPQALGEAISRLLADAQFARRVGEAARLAAEGLFDWRGVAREIVSSYERDRQGKNR